MERKLIAILCAEVFGHSRLMGEDEETVLRTLTSYRKLIDGLVRVLNARSQNPPGGSTGEGGTFDDD
jgi:hypothetical protein